MLSERTSLKPIKRMSSARKLQVSWPPKTSTRLSSEEETSEGREIPGFSGSVEQEQRGIKDKIHLYESIAAHKSRDLSFLGYGGDGDSLTMKLRRTYLDDSNRSNDDSSEVLADLSLSPAGQSLPQPAGCRRISYRIRYETAMKRDRFTAESALELQQQGGKRIGGRGIHGSNQSNSWMTCSDDSNIGGVQQDSSQLSSRHRRSSNPENRTNNWTDETNDDDDDDDDDDDTQEVDRTRGCRGYARPDVWITTINSKDGSRKWIAKRVWGIEEKDNEEIEYEVDHSRLMDGVRDLLCVPEDLGEGIRGCRGYNRPDGVQDLLCVPEDLGEGIRGCRGYNRPDGVQDLLCVPEDLGETTNELQVNISPPLAIPGTPFSIDDDKSDPWATVAHRDSSPVPPRQNQFIIMKFIDIDGKLEGSGSTLSMGEDDFDATKLEHITDVTSHEKQTNLANCSVVSYSYTSVMESSFTSIDDCASPVSVSVSVPTQSTENDQQISEDDAHGEDGGDDVPNRKKISKNERWLSTYRPDDDEAASALAQQSAENFSDHLPKGRNPLPATSDDSDFYNVPHGAADEDELSSGDGSGGAHNQRGSGRPDLWLMKKNGGNEVSDPQSWRSNTSNTTIDDGDDGDKDVYQENKTKKDYDSEPSLLVGGEEQSESVSWRSNTSIGDGDDDVKDLHQENETKRDYDPGPSLLVDGEEHSEYVYQSKHNRNKNGINDPKVKGNKDEDCRKKKDKKKSKKKKKAKKEKKKKAEDDTPLVPKDNEYDSSEDAKPINVKESNVELWWHGDEKKAKKEKKKKKKKKAEDDTPVVPKDNEYDSSEDEERYGSPTWKKRANPVNVKESNVKLWWHCD